MNKILTGEYHKPIVLFDGYCNLCSNSVVFVVKREKRDVFRFASLQSGFADKLLKKVSIENEPPDSIMLVEGDRTYFRSSAALRIAKKLKWPWPLLYAFIIIPRFIRDWVYDAIAKRRYRWFGKKDQCFIPPKDMSHKFLDG
ncbi:MAG: thiol-disulfide oxidoreductase DCC family protein [Bacteroidota bacterium]